MKITIEGMHCNSCASLIEGELEDLGVSKVSVSYASENAEIEFDESKVSEREIIDKIRKMGYKVVGVRE